MVVDPKIQDVKLKDPYTGTVYQVKDYGIYVFGAAKQDKCTMYLIAEGRDVEKVVGTKEYIKGIVGSTRNVRILG